MVMKQGLRCVYCRPDSPLAKRAKKEEEKVAAALDACGLVYQREVHIDYRCLRAASGDKHFARLDFLIERPTKRVILEVDENQHKDVTYDVSCDLARMTNVLGAITCSDNERPTQWIRYNPHRFQVGGCKTRVSTKRRLQQLVNTILSDVFPDTSLDLVYMYYDTVGCCKKSLPTICHDPMYDDRMKQVLRTVLS
jgi:hypothetical protein